MSELHPLLNGADTKFSVGDKVAIDDGPFAMEDYVIVEVLGSGDIAQYAVRGVKTGTHFSYFRDSELRRV